MTEEQWRKQHRKWWNDNDYDPADFLVSERAWIAAKRQETNEVITTIDPIKSDSTAE